MEFETEKIEKFPESLQYTGKKAVENENAYELVSPLAGKEVKLGEVPEIAAATERNVLKEAALTRGLKEVGTFARARNVLKARPRTRTRKLTSSSNRTDTRKNIVELPEPIPSATATATAAATEVPEVTEPATEAPVTTGPDLKESIAEVVKGKKTLSHFPSSGIIEKPESSFEKLLVKVQEKTKENTAVGKAFAELYAKIYVYFLALYLVLEQQGIQNEAVNQFLTGDAEMLKIPEELLDPTLKKQVLDRITGDPFFKTIVEEEYFAVKPKGEGNEQFIEQLMDISELVNNLDQLEKVF